MNAASTVRARLASGYEGIRSILRDRRGVAAVEFAFIAPMLLCAYFISMEASQGLEVNRKVARIGSTVADLITQQQSVRKADVKAMMDIGEAAVQPYNRSDPTLEVTAIQFGTESTPVARVLWSMKLNDQGNPVAVVAANTEVNDPKLLTLRSPGAFFIRVSSNLSYQPVITWSEDTAPVGLLSAFSNIRMGETFYLAPRRSVTIPCSDCPT